MKNKNKQPIGVFDSGLGGLTVVKQLQRILPNEYLVYFGDTARIPYGTKSKWLIQRFAMEDALFLLDFNIKILVVACNTASSSALPVLQDRLDIPVVGVVEPGAHAAVAATRNKKIGVIGTSATIASGSYARSLKALMPQAEIFNQACPLLVSLVEEGWLDDEVTVLTLKKYLKPLMEARVDTIILGCTHYPLLEPVIRRIVGPEVTLIDSGKETAKAVQQILKDHQLLNPDSKKGEDQYFVSDSPEAFAKVGSLFLGKPLPGVKRVDFDRFLIEKSSSPFLQNLNEVIHAD